MTKVDLQKAQKAQEIAVAEFGFVSTSTMYKMKLAEQRTYAIRVGATEEQVAKLKGFYLRRLIEELVSAKFEEIIARGL